MPIPAICQTRDSGLTVTPSILSIPPVCIPLIVAGDAVHSADVLDISDPNQLPQQVQLARCSLARPEHIRQAVCAGRTDPDGWRSLPADRRRTTLERVAAALGQLPASSFCGDSELRGTIRPVDLAPREFPPVAQAEHNTGSGLRAA